MQLFVDTSQYLSIPQKVNKYKAYIDYLLKLNSLTIKNFFEDDAKYEKYLSFMFKQLDTSVGNCMCCGGSHEKYDKLFCLPCKILIYKFGKHILDTDGYIAILKHPNGEWEKVASAKLVAKYGKEGSRTQDYINLTVEGKSIVHAIENKIGANIELSE